MKKNIINLIIIALIIAIVILGYFIFSKYYFNYINEKNINEFIEQNFTNIETENNNQDTVVEIPEYKGYKVLGIINIDKIDLSYPILEAPTNKDEALNVSIIKFYGNDLNDFGNVTLAGHNYYDSTMFAKLHQLEEKDIVKIVDNNRNSVNYSIYQKYNTSPNDIKCLETTDSSIREITLITCTKGNTERLVIKAKQIN